MVDKIFGGTDIEVRDGFTPRLVPANTIIEVYSDAAGTQPVSDFKTVLNDPFSVLRTTADSKIPFFVVDENPHAILYVRIAGGPLSPIYPITGVDDGLDDSTVQVVRYTTSWPARPPGGAAITVFWIGGVPENPPPGGLVNVDVWIVEDPNGGGTQTPDEDAVRIVRFSTAWPSRPAGGSAITVIWVGGTPENPPPGLTNVDLWIVEDPNPGTGSGGAPEDHTHPVSDLEPGVFTAARLPAGVLMVVEWDGDSWPVRPTARPDIPVLYAGGVEATPPTDAVVGKDLWLREVVTP